MNPLLQFVMDWWKSLDRGDLPNYPDPAAPSDLGTPLTQDEIDFVKKLKKEIDERFNPL
jgi:hypothetical protein